VEAPEDPQELPEPPTLAASPKAKDERVHLKDKLQGVILVVGIIGSIFAYATTPQVYNRDQVGEVLCTRIDLTYALRDCYIPAAAAAVRVGAGILLGTLAFAGVSVMYKDEETESESGGVSASKSGQSDSRGERSVFARCLTAGLWCLPILVVVRGAVGALMGVLAADLSVPGGENYYLGLESSVAFFEAYGLVVNVAAVFLTAWLSWVGLLPGTSKWKTTPSPAQ